MTTVDSKKPGIIIVRNRDRRILAVLLIDAGNLSGWPLAQLSGVGVGRVYVLLARLENAGLVATEWESRQDAAARQYEDHRRSLFARRAERAPRRRFYRLTPEGRAWAMRELGLEPAEESTHGS